MKLYLNLELVFDINDKYIIVGADIHNNVNSVNLSKSGAAYIFKIPESGNTWSQTKIIASDAGENARFGNAVALLGDRAIVGSYGKFINNRHLIMDKLTIL